MEEPRGVGVGVGSWVVDDLVGGVWDNDGGGDACVAQFANVSIQSSRVLGGGSAGGSCSIGQSIPAGFGSKGLAKPLGPKVLAKLVGSKGWLNPCRGAGRKTRLVSGDI
eukprot:18114-Chlamydomonas_euryale.AAC.2